MIELPNVGFALDNFDSNAGFPGADFFSNTLAGTLISGAIDLELDAMISDIFTSVCVGVGKLVLCTLFLDDAAFCWASG